MTVIGLVHPGEMGAAVGAALVRAGHEVLWASAGRSAETAERARAASLTDAGSLDALADRAEVILSICPPHAAVEVARSLRGFDGLYADANAVSPDTVRSMSAVQARLVDGGIVGPPPAVAGTTRVYLSGPEAERVACLLAGTPAEVRIVSAEIGAASAVKMAYAGWTKGTAALLLSLRALARAEGVEEALLAEWETSLPELAARSEAAARAALTKGWRWAGEMEEIAATMTSAGLPGDFHAAAAEIYRRVARKPGAPGDSVGADEPGGVNGAGRSDDASASDPISPVNLALAGLGSPPGVTAQPQR